MDADTQPRILALEVAVWSSSSGSGLANVVNELTGRATLRIDRGAIPHLRKVFDDALTKLDEQIEIAMTGIRVSPWAGDPVSQNAASQLNDHSVDGAYSALNALRAYQQQLKSASDALTKVAEEYQVVEADNTSSLGAVSSSLPSAG